MIEEQFIEKDGKRYQVMWKNQMPPEPVLVEVKG